MKGISARVGTSLKAVFAGLTALLAGVGTALVGAHTFSAVSDGQWISIASLAIVAFGAVYGVTNAAPSPPAPPKA